MSFSGLSSLLLVRPGKTVLLFLSINRIVARSFQAVPFFKGPIFTVSLWFITL